MHDFVTITLLAALIHGCSAEPPAGPNGELPPADVRVLFVGNSLTYSHGIPGIVQALADATGRSMSHAVIVAPGVSLEDHWAAGLAGEIERLRPDIVVMQQGPSSLPESREHLVTWSGRIADVTRAAGGEPALYMVWPEGNRMSAFAAVYDSYRAAADAVDGGFMPAGRAWQELWSRDASAQLYGPDGFHPSYLGALVAAHTIFAVLFDADPMAAPSLDARVPAAMLELVRESVAASIEGVTSGTP